MQIYMDEGHKYTTYIGIKALPTASTLLAQGSIRNMDPHTFAPSPVNTGHIQLPAKKH